MNKIDPTQDPSPLKRFMQGSFLAGCVSSCSAPGVYLSNMVSSHTRPKFSNAFRGIGITAFNDIPATAVSFTIQSIVTKHLLTDRHQTSQKFIASGIAGACAGIVITPGEMIVLKYQQNQKKLSMIEIAKKAYRTAGIKRLFLGVPAVIVREGSYTSSYFVLNEIVAEWIKPIVPHEELRVGLGGFLSGAIVGAVTTPAKILTVRMQDQVFSQNVTSYKEEIKKLTLRAIGRNALIRAPLIGFSSFLLTEGRRHLFKD